MKKSRVAVYIRIHKNDELKLQTICDEYRNKIANRKDCQLAEIYCDVGVSGLDYKRTGYLRMLEAARNHEFDWIVTKHSGKLTRRALELRRIIIDLRQAGVEIYFEDGGIETLQIINPLEYIV